MRISQVFVLVGAFASVASAGNKPVASGPLKAYHGPEGALVVMLEVNDSKQMLVQLKGIGGGIADGKTVLYLLADEGHGNKRVYTVKKQGHKTYEAYILVAKDNAWTFFHPLNDTSFDLRYSSSESEKLKAEDMINAFSP